MHVQTDMTKPRETAPMNCDQIISTTFKHFTDTKPDEANADFILAKLLAFLEFSRPIVTTYFVDLVKAAHGAQSAGAVMQNLCDALERDEPNAIRVTRNLAGCFEIRTQMDAVLTGLQQETERTHAEKTINKEQYLRAKSWVSLFTRTWQKFSESAPQSDSNNYRDGRYWPQPASYFDETGQSWRLQGIPVSFAQFEENLKQCEGDIVKTLGKISLKFGPYPNKEEADLAHHASIADLYAKTPDTAEKKFGIVRLFRLDQ
jgi:hypothetical protein